MEHFFLHFFVKAVESITKAIDGLFEKSLKKAIPDLDLLREDPNKALEDNGIVIGPRRKYFSATLIGLVMACAGVGLWILIFSIIQDLPGRKRFSHAFWYVSLSTVGLCCFVWGFRLLRGGYCVITHQGVEFRYRKKVVRCSWSVFHAWGQWVFIEESNILLVPISPYATDSIMEMNKEESAACRAGLEVSTPQWETHSLVEAALKPLYAVKIQELAELLLHVGRKLGTDQGTIQSLISKTDRSSRIQTGVDASRQLQQAAGRSAPRRLPPADSKSFPVAFQEDNGWIRMSLSSFYLPAYCCICTVPTGNSFLFKLRNHEDSDSYYPLHLPACDQCCAKLKKQKRIRNLLVFALPPVLFIAMSLLFNNLNQPALIICLVIGPPLFSIVGILAVMEKVYPAPAQVRYSSKKGTLRLRFPNPDFQKMVLAQRVHR